MAKILIAEDDVELASTVRKLLEFEKHTVDAVDNGSDALNSILSQDYDAIVLDWQLPLMSGVDVCQTYRGKGGTAPILLLTGKSAVQDKEQGLDSGADDYLTKPFHPKELTARIRAMIRRATSYQTEIVSLGPFKLDREQHLFYRDGELLHLQPMEFVLLEYFMTHPGQVVSPESLLAKLWDASDEVSLDAIYTCIRRLRKKLDKPGCESFIRTVHGVGYGINPKMI